MYSTTLIELGQMYVGGGVGGGYQVFAFVYTRLQSIAVACCRLY